MKLVRYGKPGSEKPGLVDAAGKLRDLSEIIEDINGETLSPRVLARIAKIKPDALPAVRGKPRLGPCVGNVGNFIAVGLNYADHAAESNMPIPKEPILFNKAPSCIVGPHDDVVRLDRLPSLIRRLRRVPMPAGDRDAVDRIMRRSQRPRRSTLGSGEPLSANAQGRA